MQVVPRWRLDIRKNLELRINVIHSLEKKAGPRRVPASAPGAGGLGLPAGDCRNWPIRGINDQALRLHSNWRVDHGKPATPQGSDR